VDDLAILIETIAQSVTGTMSVAFYCGEADLPALYSDGSRGSAAFRWCQRALREKPVPSTLRTQNPAARTERMRWSYRLAQEQRAKDEETGGAGETGAQRKAYERAGVRARRTEGFTADSHPQPTSGSRLQLMQ